MDTCDVYAFGVISASTICRVRGAFPGPEGYAEIDSIDHATGGEAANSSLVLARLGLRVKLDGCWLGDDDAGRRTKALLDAERIDTSRLPLREDVDSVQEVVFAAEGTRTIFGSYCRLQETRHWNAPDADDVASAGVLCLDPFLGAESRRAAELASMSGKPVVTVDCRYDDPLLGHSSVAVIAESFIRENYAGVGPRDLFRSYQEAADGLVLFTFGASETWFSRSGEPIRTFQPFPIEPVDTSGGGDAFRAGIVYGLHSRWSDERTVEFASALAAIVCTRFPGVMHAPRIAEVRDFLEVRRARR